MASAVKGWSPVTINTLTLACVVGTLVREGDQSCKYRQTYSAALSDGILHAFLWRIHQGSQTDERKAPEQVSANQTYK